MDPFSLRLNWKHKVVRENKLRSKGGRGGGGYFDPWPADPPTHSPPLTQRDTQYLRPNNKQKVDGK